MKSKYEYLSIKAAAEYLGVSRATIYSWINKGSLKFKVHPMNKRRLICNKDLATILTELKRQHEDL